MQDSTVFVGPSVVGHDGDRDGLPTTLIEAMALGTPCVSTDVAGIPEVIHDGQTGMMVPQHDAVALANAIEQLLLSPKLGTLISRKARTLVESKFDVHKNMKVLRDVFFNKIALEVASQEYI
jgi:colanic acid/amylovoran biosynthesis glycosyltransferase